MSLTQALSTAMSGLRATQANLSLVSSNVANADTPGYVRKTGNQVTTNNGFFGSGVRVTGVNRQLDEYLTRQLRTEMSGQGFAGMRAQFLSRLQSIYGAPGSQATLETALSNLTSALQALSTSPDSQSARINVINAAQAMAQQLNATSQGIQALRTDAEQGIAGAVNTANNAMAQIAAINGQLLRSGASDAETAALHDQRDQYINQLSQLMDIRTSVNEAGQVTVFTSSGLQLVGATEAAKLSFDARGMMTPTSEWSRDPLERGVGTITLTLPRGGSVDLIDTKAFRSGEIAAYLDLRDNTLVQAQAQIDQIAAVMASALSDKTTLGTAATSGAQTGFDVDLAGLAAGNVVNLTYTDGTGTHNVSIVRVDDSSVLPLPDSATVNPNDRVVGIDFSGGMASVLSQLNGALGGGNLQFSNPSGSVLRVLDDGATNFASIDALSVTTTQTSLTGGSPELALFTDGGVPFTGAFGVAGPQVTGFSSRITVNSALTGDPSKLVLYSPTSEVGDTTRPDFLYQQLRSAQFYFSPASGVGTSGQPFRGSILSFAQQVISMQGEAASAASQLAEGQDVVVNTLHEKFQAVSGVNIDEEMAHLLALQNAYAANARVMSVIKDMFGALMQM